MNENMPYINVFEDKRITYLIGVVATNLKLYFFPQFTLSRVVMLIPTFYRII